MFRIQKSSILEYMNYCTTCIIVFFFIRNNTVAERYRSYAMYNSIMQAELQLYMKTEEGAKHRKLIKT